MTKSLRAQSTALFIAALIIITVLSLAAMVKAQSITVSFGNIGRTLLGGLK